MPSYCCYEYKRSYDETPPLLLFKNERIPLINNMMMKRRVLVVVEVEVDVTGNIFFETMSSFCCCYKRSYPPLLLFQNERIPLINKPQVMMMKRRVLVVVEVEVDVTGNSLFETMSSSCCCAFRRLQRGPTLLFHFTHAGTK